MKTFLIVLGIIYLVIAVLAFIFQSLGTGGDQSHTPWDLIFKQSIGWPIVLIKILVR